MAKSSSSTSSSSSSSDPTTQQDAAPSYSLPKLSNYQVASGFNQGVQYASLAARNASSLDSLQQFLNDLANDTQSLMSAVDTAETNVQNRVRSGVPPPQGNLPPPPPPAPPPTPDTSSTALGTAATDGASK